MKEELKIMVGVVALVSLVLLVIATIGKFFRHGESTYKGRVIGVKYGFENCISLSRTSKGESANIDCCSYSYIDRIKIGDNLEIKCTLSPFPFMDKVEVINEAI